MELKNNKWDNAARQDSTLGPIFGDGDIAIGHFPYQPLPNHMYFETDFKVFKRYFQYLNTIFLYFNPI